MGRQFSYYAFPEDLAEIEREVFRPTGSRLLVAEKRDARHYIQAVDSFPLALERMGTETLFLLLAPPLPIEKLVFSDAWLDTTRSHLIEVGRSHIKDGQIGEARFWYEPSPLRGDQFVEKPAEFLSWASDVYRKTKKLLVRHAYFRGNHEYKCWCGAVAKQELAAGRVSPR